MSGGIAASLAPYYAGLRHAHIGLVLLSVTLFTARGLGVLARSRWPLAPALRRASVAIDSGLLAAGVALWLTLGLNPVRDSWLGVKLLLLLVYIVTGALALKRAPTPAAKALCFVLALASVGSMALIARAHDARAPLALIGSLLG